MSAGAVFLLVVVLIVVAALGGGLYALIAWLRHKQLDPEGDEIEGPPEEQPRPEHVAVENEQRTRFAGTR